MDATDAGDVTRLMACAVCLQAALIVPDADGGIDSQAFAMMGGRKLDHCRFAYWHDLFELRISCQSVK
jgi:hypothetical protein